MSIPNNQQRKNIFHRLLCFYYVSYQVFGQDLSTSITHYGLQAGPKRLPHMTIFLAEVPKILCRKSFLYIGKPSKNTTIQIFLYFRLSLPGQQGDYTKFLSQFEINVHRPMVAFD